MSLDTPGRSHRRSSSTQSNEELIDGISDKPKYLQLVDEEDIGIDKCLCLKPLKSEFVNDERKQASMDSVTETLQPDLDGPLKSESINVIFSPRKTTAMLQFYADRMSEATASVHLTAPFGVSQQFAKVLSQGRKQQDDLRRSPRIAKRYSSIKGTTRTDLSTTDTLLRYILFDRKPSEHTSKKAREIANKKGMEYFDYFDFRGIKENRTAYGAVLSDEKNELDEDLTGLTSFVDFVHLKIMLIDAMTDNPTVVTGSANFSEASTDRNDENMLVIQGNCAVADIYLTEYMRLFNHFQPRDDHVKLKHSSGQTKKPFDWGQIVNDESWLKPYFDPTNQLYRERMLFR